MASRCKHPQGNAPCHALCPFEIEENKISELLESQIADDEVYLAGQPAPAGRYKQIDTRREICLEEAGALPASLDGRVACYERIKSTWSETQQKDPSFQAVIAVSARR